MPSQRSDGGFLPAAARGGRRRRRGGNMSSDDEGEDLFDGLENRAGVGDYRDIGPYTSTQQHRLASLSMDHASSSSYTILLSGGRGVPACAFSIM